MCFCVCSYVCTCVWKHRLTLGISLDFLFTLYIEPESLNQTQSLQVWPVCLRDSHLHHLSLLGGFRGGGLNSVPLVCTANTLLTGHWALLLLNILTLLLCKFLTPDTLTFRMIYVIKSMLVFSLRVLFLVSCLNSNFSITLICMALG